MGFYEEIAKHYDDIFPAGKVQEELLLQMAGEPEADVLDIACGTGGYSISLARAGHNVTAVDLDEKMIDALKDKVKGQKLNIRAHKMNMMDISALKTSFDLAYCIGNSLVHLDSVQQVTGFLKEAKKVLKKGKLVIQIINYDRILKQDIKSLPTIENKEAGLTFERLYRFDKVENKVYFKTILNVDENTYDNEIPLLPLTSDELESSLKEAGFEDVVMYGDFKKSPYDKDESYALVAVAK
ncbi:class I SAM-dependent methyltransferase [Alkalibacter saccharofermentans]|uniref:Methyltransferase domain-containing protein n=1 Tax=Alkalibacter saccharofermentans DSM 14828 TaxID=1120975 RepID=A0A1M4WLS9_9FIRM|nr:class I SAM-dependent methyltransferase [Alkalibacter saccharofermentans]SHE82188.1 Methyltransferase domain-containing protein [Alkalibacter saccharofermentans DSM 14828]